MSNRELAFVALGITGLVPASCEGHVDRKAVLDSGWEPLSCLGVINAALHVGRIPATIALTPLLEPENADKAALDLCSASLPPNWISLSPQEEGSGGPHQPM